MSTKILLSKAISAARKPLRFLPAKQQEKNLEFACGSLSEAYRIGAEEAQSAIVNRLLELEKFGAGK